VQNKTSPLVLSFGATDPVGAIGIQADLAAFSAMGCHGLSVVTAILIADTARVEDMQAVDPEWVADQARALLEDMQIAAFKIGVVGSADNASVIAEILSDYPEIPLIFDPFASAVPNQVMEDDELLGAIRDLLVPQATVLIASEVELTRFSENWRDAATPSTIATDTMRLIGAGCEYALVTGISSDSNEVSNMLFDQSGLIRHDAWPRQPGSFSGSGATLSAALTALIANGLELSEAILEAQEFTHASIAAAQRLGMGRLVPDRYFWTRDAEDEA
jgi:hydroxymethylpyrimidine/phosphomethylpyrimidine kinase